jgi:hypothetical protein
MTVDENHLPVGAKFFPKPYNESAIVEAMRGMLPKAEWQHPPTSEVGLGSVYDSASTVGLCINHADNAKT